jgi:hypothetical protein
LGSDLGHQGTDYPGQEQLHSDQGQHTKAGEQEGPSVMVGIIKDEAQRFQGRCSFYKGEIE